MHSKLLKRIIELAVEINGLGPNSQKHESKTPTVFLNMYGHTATIKLDIVEGCWTSSENPNPESTTTHEYRAHLRSNIALESLVDVLEAVKEKYIKEITERMRNNEFIRN